MKLVFSDEVSKATLQRKLGHEEDSSIEYVLHEDGFIYQLNDSDNIVGEVLVTLSPGPEPKPVLNA